MPYKELENSITEATEGVLERDKETPAPIQTTEQDYLLMAFNSLLQAYLMRSGGLEKSNLQPMLNSPLKTFATQG